MDQACDNGGRPLEIAENSTHNSPTAQILTGARNLRDCNQNGASLPNAHSPELRDNDSASTLETEKLTGKTVRLRDQISIIIGPPIILLLDLVAPCIIYYVWLNDTRSQWERACGPRESASRTCPILPPVYDQWILGLSIMFFGLGELYILVARCYRLIRHHAEYAPLLSVRLWELDATSWIYGSSLLVALVPFVVSSSVRNGIPWLFLYSPTFLVAYLEIWAIITLFAFKLPIRVDSDPAGSRVQPLIYYAAEDFIAVDGCQGREFRRRFRARYQVSASFRRMILHLTLFWIAGCTIYLGCLSAVIWNLQFEFAFGLTLGLLFFWILLWSVLTYIWIHIQMADPRRS